MKIGEPWLCFIFVLLAASFCVVTVGAVLDSPGSQSTGSENAINSVITNYTSYALNSSTISETDINLNQSLAVATIPTKLTLKQVRMIGFTGRLTGTAGQSLAFTKLAKISLYRNGVLKRSTTACGKGYYLFKTRWPLPRGSYQTRFEGQGALNESASRKLSIG